MQCSDWRGRASIGLTGHQIQFLQQIHCSIRLWTSTCLLSLRLGENAQTALIWDFNRSLINFGTVLFNKWGVMHAVDERLARATSRKRLLGAHLVLP